MRTLILLGLMIVLFTIAAHSETMAEIMSGKAFPLTTPTNALNAEWRQFPLTGAQGGATDMLLLMARLRMGTGGTSTLYVTQGKTVTIGNETYLVVYHREGPDNLALLAMMQHGEAAALAPVTPDDQFVLSLLNLRAIGCMRDIKPFDLGSLNDGADLLAGVMARAGRKAREATLKADLHQLRNALEQFQADTGLYPEKLIDLTVAQANAPKHGVNEKGELKDIPAGAYVGPYLAGGGIGDTGIPMNPFADPAAGIDAHWIYGKDGPGMIHPAAPMEGTTLDGIPYDEL